MTPTIYILLANLYTLTALALVVLRALHRIAWPWWAVTAPLWGPLGVALACFIVLGLYVACERLVAALQTQIGDA